MVLCFFRYSRAVWFSLLFKSCLVSVTKEPVDCIEISVMLSYTKFVKLPGFVIPDIIDLSQYKIIIIKKPE